MRGHPVRLAPAFVLLLLTACTPIVKALHPNQRPSVHFTLAPVVADRKEPVFYAYRVFWAGDDPDGRVDHFDYAVDPGAGDTVWVSTPRSEEVLFFRSTQPDGNPGPLPTSSDYHLLVLRAVDDHGAVSARTWRAFYSYTVAPTVQIVSPPPNEFLPAVVPPTIAIRWQGSDPDGQTTQHPVKYRFRLLPFDRVNDNWMLNQRDSLYRRELRAGFADWDSSGGDSTSVTYTNLTPRSEYLFVIIAWDEAGARTPLFLRTDNMLSIAVDLAATLGPIFHVWNEFIDFTYDSGGYTVDPLRWIRFEAPADRPMHFNWDAHASAGAHIDNYRWGLDLASVQDDTPRTDEDHDYQHWSQPSPLSTSCTLYGLAPGPHFFYIEATDNNGYSSLAVAYFKLVVPTFENQLLVVVDTRFEVDRVLPSGCLDWYKDRWPSTAELDTFLFARGGFPWRCTQEPPSGLFSAPGVFAGYSFDTLGTRLGLENPAAGVPLSTLGRYKNVVWLADVESAKLHEVLPLSGTPISVLRYTSAPGRASALAAYVQAGGRVWLAGGGAGSASIDGFNKPVNDGEGRTYGNDAGELVPGRLMYDGAHWQSSFTFGNALISFRRSGAAERIAGAPWTHRDPWTGGEMRAPDYLRLPAELGWRDPATDPLPPTRRANQSGLYYRSGFPCEYLLTGNFVTEDMDPSDEGVQIMSTLDTLIDASSFLLRRSPAPTMTWYHGAGANRFVFSGFAPWDFRRADCIALADFVLQDLWGLVRRPVDRGVPAGSVAGPRPAGPRVRNPLPEQPSRGPRLAPARPVLPNRPGTARSPGGYQRGEP
jgi:hypothetical protein